MENPVSQRVIKIIEYLGISRRKFAESINVSQSTFMSSYIRNSDFRSSHLSSIIEAYPNINSEWLLTGKGEMIKGSSLINKGVIGDKNEISSIISGDGNNIRNSNVGNSGGNFVTVSLPEKGKSKIINDKGIEMTYESLSDEATQHRINFLLAEIDSLKKIIDSLHREIASNKDNYKEIIDSKNEIIEMLKVQLGQKNQK